MTWDELLAAAALPRLEARALLEHAGGRGRAWLIAHGNEPAPGAEARAFLSLAARRRAGEPLAYLVGWREFHGRRFEVCADVLIPRPETELLVELAVARAPRGGSVLDLGTGSGAIAVSVAAARPDLRVVATDRSAAALAVAARNASAHSARVEFRAGSWWDALRPGETFDVVVSNPPYIAARDPHLGEGDLRFEPPSALASGDDGLDALREIAAGAPARLAPGGWLMVEHGWDQAPAVARLLADAGLADVETHADAAGIGRVTAGRLPPRASRGFGPV